MKVFWDLALMLLIFGIVVCVVGGVLGLGAALFVSSETDVAPGIDVASEVVEVEEHSRQTAEAGAESDASRPAQVEKIEEFLRQAVTSSSPAEEEPERPAPELDSASLPQFVVDAVVTANSRKLDPCFARARKRGRLRAGNYVLTVDMAIAANGVPTEVELVSPDAFRRHGMPTCIARRMRRWRFPANAVPTILEDYLVPITLK